MRQGVMRAFLAALLVLSVAGCGLDLPDFNGRENTFPDTPATPRDPRCAAVATDRASDVAMQGFDEALQHAVFEQVYADCVAWKLRGSRMTEP